MFLTMDETNVKLDYMLLIYNIPKRKEKRRKKESDLPAISTRMLISSLKFLIAASPFKIIGKMPMATAPRANQRNG